MEPIIIISVASACFKDTDYIALLRIIELMSKKHEFDYETRESPHECDMVIFQDKAPQDWKIPTDSRLPQIFIMTGSSYHTCIGSQFNTSWAHIESLIPFLANCILHQREKEPAKTAQEI